MNTWNGGHLEKYGHHFEFHVANGIFRISSYKGVSTSIVVLVPQILSERKHLVYCTLIMLSLVCISRVLIVTF
jgi:hypothetical protein